MKRQLLFALLAGWAERKPWMMLGFGLIATLIAAVLASGLELNMQFKNMMPQSHPTVQEYDQIVEQYASASSLIVVVQGEESQIKSFADATAPRIRAMSKYVRRLDYRVDTDFVGRHGFMLVKAKDLKNSQDQFEDLGLLPLLTTINNAFEQTYVVDSESISNGEKEDNAVRAIDGITTFLTAMRHYVDGSGTDESVEQAVDRFLIGDPYFISQDKDMLLLFVQPTFTMNDVELMVEAVNAVDSLLLDQERHYPGVSAGTTGTLALGRDEMEAVASDMYVTSLIAFVLIIGLFILSFRMWVAPVLAGISLIVGIIWAAGVSALTVGSLNMMTSMFAVILIGLGIDYNIHVIAGYTEFRAAGEEIGEALRLALTKTGNGIVVGSVSTALAFLTMLISENLGMKEFALVAGIGVLFCMLASLLILPSLLVVRDRRLITRSGTQTTDRDITYTWAGRLAERIASHWVTSTSVVMMCTAVLLYSALNMTFDYNYLNMEPKGLRSIELQDAVIDEFDVTPDMVLVTAASVEESRTLSEAAKELGSVGMVTTISDYVPSSQERNARLPYILRIRDNLSAGRASVLSESDIADLTDELYRLEDNLIELAQLAYVGGQDKVDRRIRAVIGDLDTPVESRENMLEALVEAIVFDPASATVRLQLFQRAYEPILRSKAGNMTAEDEITVADLPTEIRNQFVSDDGSRYLVSIYPRQQVWDFEFLGRFTEQMHRIDPRVTGLPPIFYVLIDYIGRDGTIAAILAITVIFLLLWIDFRSLSLALMAMATLGTGAVWMVGVMHLVGMQFNLVNTIGIPLILGIGIDDSVHILNRYRVEGQNQLNVVYAGTGKAVILTSLTTMIAFGSLAFAVYRGLGSLGITLLIGVGTALLATFFLLPALLGAQVAWSKRSGRAVHGQTPNDSVPGMLKVLLPGMLMLTAIGSVQAQEIAPDVLELVRKIDANERVNSSHTTGRQIITTSSGSERTLEMESFAVGENEKMLTVYTGPARVRGDKILMLNDGDDIWFYTPKTDRVRHLASHARRQKVQGSDFAYEDMISGNLEEDYTHRLMRVEDLDGVSCYVIESIPTETGPSYSRIVVWAEVERLITRRIDYYDDGDLLKRLKSDDIMDVEGHWIPFTMEMTNLRDGGKTVFIFDDMSINVDLDESMFSTNNLSRR